MKKLFRSFPIFYLAAGVLSAAFLFPAAASAADLMSWVLAHPEIQIGKDAEAITQNVSAQFEYPVSFIYPECVPQKNLLTFDERLALLTYTAYGYKIVNKALRENDTAQLREAQDFSDLLSTALAKLPLKHGWVYRYASLPASVIDKYKVGATVPEPAFTSTTRGALRDLLDLGGNPNVIFKIGTNSGRDIHCFSGHHDENEWLFDKGSSFKVVTVETDAAGKTLIELEHVSQPGEDFSHLSEPKAIQVVRATFQPDDSVKRIVDISEKVQAECNGRAKCFYDLRSYEAPRNNSRSVFKVFWKCTDDETIHSDEESGYGPFMSLSAKCKDEGTY